MVANTFLTVIPGWINTDDPVSDQEAGSFSVSPSPNTSSDVHYDIEVDQSVDINLTQNNPMWRILSEVGIDVISVTNEDWNDELETEDDQLGLDEAIP